MTDNHRTNQHFAIYRNQNPTNNPTQTQLSECLPRTRVSIRRCLITRLAIARAPGKPALGYPLVMGDEEIMVRYLVDVGLMHLEAMGVIGV